MAEAPGNAEAPVVIPAVGAAGDEGQDRNPSRKQNPMTDGTAARPARRDLTLAVTDLLRNMPDMGATASERDAWLLRKKLLLSAIEEASR
jgi:hypothetical protein